MSRFQAGALVVYGNLGVHEVEGVGLRHFCDEPAREYYTLRPYFSDSHDRSYIPSGRSWRWRLGNRSRKPAGVCWRFCAEAAWVLFGAYIQFKDVVVVGSISYIYYLVLIDPF